MKKKHYTTLYIALSLFSLLSVIIINYFFIKLPAVKILPIILFLTVFNLVVLIILRKRVQKYLGEIVTTLQKIEVSPSVDNYQQLLNLFYQQAQQEINHLLPGFQYLISAIIRKQNFEHHIREIFTILHHNIPLEQIIEQTLKYMINNFDGVHARYLSCEEGILETVGAYGITLPQEYLDNLMNDQPLIKKIFSSPSIKQVNTPEKLDLSFFDFDPGEILFVPVVKYGDSIGFFLFIGRRNLALEEKNILAILTQQLAFIISNLKLHKKINRASLCDFELGEVYDKREGLRHLGAEIDRVQRYKSFFTLVMLKINIPEDVFKKKKIRSQILRQSVYHLKSRKRLVDTLFRYQDRFVMILPSTTTEQAEAFCRSLDSYFGEHPVIIEQESFYIKSAFGVCQYHKQVTPHPDDLIEQAAQHLNDALDQKVVLVETPLPECAEKSQ